MSIKSICYFSIGFIGDGTAASKTVNFSSAPFVLASHGSVPGIAAQMSSAFVLSTTLPTAIADLFSSDSQAVTATLGLLGAVTFAWPNAIPNGDKVNVYGTIHF